MKELERKMMESETKKNSLAEEGARLGEIMEEVAKAGRSSQLPTRSMILTLGLLVRDVPIPLYPPCTCPKLRRLSSRSALTPSPPPPNKPTLQPQQTPLMLTQRTGMP